MVWRYMVSEENSLQAAAVASALFEEVARDMASIPRLKTATLEVALTTRVLAQVATQGLGEK